MKFLEDKNESKYKICNESIPNSDWILTYHQTLHNDPDTFPNPPHLLPLKLLLVVNPGIVPDSS